MRNETILIPAYEPSLKMITLIRNLKDFGFYKIIVINDGSDSSYDYIFDDAANLGCKVFEHFPNRGKGYSLREGIDKHLALYGNSYGVITVDADGQHLARDTAKISNAMYEYPDSLILGVRDFNGENVPFKSRYGNKITSMFFKLETGIKCPDTQTGLRGIPASLLHLAINTDGSRYEYEMNFLEAAAYEAPMKYIPIETVYEDNNSCSHFRPFRDSVRIYGKPLKFAASSLAGAAVDIGVFYILLLLLRDISLSISIVAIATVLARICSGIANFIINKLWCFKSKNKTGSDIIKYSLLFLFQMGMSALLVTYISRIIPTLITKIIVDVGLFFLSYTIQKRFIFKAHSEKNKTDNQPAEDRSIYMKKKRPIWAVLYGSLLAGYTTFTLLDAFVIPHNTVNVADTSGGSLYSINQSDSDNDTYTENSNSDNDTYTENSNSDNSSNDSSSESRRHRRRSSSGKAKSRISGDISGSGNLTLNSAESDSSSTEDSQSTTATATGDTMTYESDSVSISVTTHYVNGTYIYVADIQLNGSTGIMSGLADNTLGRNITAATSEIAEDVGAVLAINGDFYGFRDSGYVIRNGYLYRTASSGSDSEDLVIYSDGTMEIIKEGDISAEELEEKGAVQIYSFGPGLVEDSAISVSEGEEVGQAMNSNPRTAVGYYSPTHYCFVVSDGRTSESEGLTLYQLAEFMQSLGVESAYNLDGGGSSTMYFNGSIVNNPTTNGNKIKERSVSDILYISKQ